MRLIFAFAVAVLLFPAFAVAAETATPNPPADATSSDIVIIRGTVVGQVDSCVRDGVCAVVVKTGQGEESIILNEGDAMPTCDINRSLADKAFKLRPGEEVEFHVRRVKEKNMLCGDGVSVGSVSESAEYHCIVPPTGAVPSQNVAKFCMTLKTQEACEAFQSSEFPYRCAWASTTATFPAYP